MIAALNVLDKIFKAVIFKIVNIAVKISALIARMDINYQLIK